MSRWDFGFGLPRLYFHVIVHSGTQRRPMIPFNIIASSYLSPTLQRIEITQIQFNLLRRIMANYITYMIEKRTKVTAFSLVHTSIYIIDLHAKKLYHRSAATNSRYRDGFLKEPLHLHGCLRWSAGRLAIGCLMSWSAEWKWRIDGAPEYIDAWRDSLQKSLISLPRCGSHEAMAI